MRKEIRSITNVCLRVDPDSPERILISTNEKIRGTEHGVRYRRRTTSLKARRPAEKRRASVPAFYRLNIKPKTTRKNLIQKIGSHLAKLGDELVGRKAGKTVEKRCENDPKSWKQYARHLAEVGDYLNALYSTDSSVVHSESDHNALVESCVILSSILVGLKNNNVVVISTNDLSALSSLCRVHRAKSLSRSRK